MSPTDPELLAEAVNSAKLSTLGMLVAGIAHELNTPLGALHSNQDVLTRALSKLSRILEDERVDETELDEVRRVVRAVGDITRVNSAAVERMVQIVGSLRTFGRLDRAQVDRWGVHEGIDAALELLEHETRGRIEVVREYGALPPIECYPQQLNQLFMNLLLNSIQAIQGVGTITIRTSIPSPESVTIEIEDTGVGIAGEHLERIFEPGFTTKGQRVGMGMGLLISSRIVEQHGGRMSVVSEVGLGTCFTIVLPVTLSVSAQPTEAS